MVFKSAFLVVLTATVAQAAAGVVTQQAEVLVTPRSGAASTGLLFAFVTTAVGFDTEITISNTSLDTVGSAPQAGACTLTFYNGASPFSQTTQSIPAGKQIVFRLSTGGSGIAAALNFTGYVMANCAFPQARGSDRIFVPGILGFAQDAQVITLPRSTAKPQGLLFPFVTNQSGFDTGIAISNTSLDPFGTPTSSGSCGLSFYNSTGAVHSETVQISPGSTFTVLVSGASPGFQGYAIASCNFTGAAGLAFVSDMGARNVVFAESAESMVLPRPSTPQPLLFSAMNNTAGQDTLFAIANTSIDPFGTAKSAGTCTLNFYDGTGAHPPVTTASIPAGGLYATPVSSLLPGFQGYLMANCSFPHARGWALTAPIGIRSDGDSQTAELVSPPRSPAPTSLLFSAVNGLSTNDSGVVIANTSLDSVGSLTGSGSCNISYFGDMSGGGSVPARQTSVVIPAGGQLTFSVAQGNPAQGIAPALGFRGYLIADCGFPLARGQATTTDAVPDMVVRSAHGANFVPGQTGATYTITVTNAGAAPTSAAVTVTDTVPAGLTATAISGIGWTCTQPAGPCNRSDILAGGAAYPVITLTVSVAADAHASVTNAVTVAGGGESNVSNDSASDVTVVQPAGPAVAPPSVTAGTTASSDVTYTFADSNGAQNLAVVNVLINSALDGRHGCYLAYAVASSTLFLVDDAGDAGGPFAGSVAAGNPNVTIQNSQCAVKLTSATVNGTTLTLALNLTFTAAFGGNKIQFLAARDAANNTDWQAQGVWQVPVAPAGQIAIGTPNPTRGAALAGTARTFSFALSDTKGNGDVGVVNVLVNRFIDGRQACYLAYASAGNTLFLVDDAGDAGGPFAGSLVLDGSAGAIQNSQCSINGASSSVQRNGNSLTLNLNITFKTGLLGNQAIWVAARDKNDGNNTDWQSVATWSVQ